MRLPLAPVFRATMALSLLLGRFRTHSTLPPGYLPASRLAMTYMLFSETAKSFTGRQ